MRGGGNWLAFLLIPIAAVGTAYGLRFLVRKCTHWIRQRFTHKSASGI